MISSPATGMRARVFQILFAMCFVSSATVVVAHQPYESSAVARLDHEGLELTVTTSVEIAGRLVGAPLSDAAALENLRPQLLESGAGLYEVSANGESLRPERVFFTSKGGEAIFSAIYPLVRGVEVRFRAAYLDKLPPGYGGSLDVFDEKGRLLGRHPLLKKGEAKDSFVVNVTAGLSQPGRAAAPATMPEILPDWAVSERTGTTPQGNAPVLNAAGICIMVLLGGAIVWQIRRSRKRKGSSQCSPVGIR